MPGAAVSIKGIDKVQNKIKVLQGLLPTQVDAALMYGAFAIEGDAKVKCPVDTGRLRDSINTHAGEADDSSEHVVCVGTNVEYAGYVELGTYKMSAQPYLRPALDEKGVEAVQRIAEKLKGELQR